MPIQRLDDSNRVDALARPAHGRVLHGTDKMRTLDHGTAVPVLEFTKNNPKSTMAPSGVLQRASLTVIL
jgi:hypothetical protein